MKKGKYLAQEQNRPGQWRWLLYVGIGLVVAALVLWPLLLPEETEEESAAQTIQTTEEPVPETQPLQPEVPAEPETTVRAKLILETMTADEKIYQLFVVTQEQITDIGTVIQSGETTKKAIEEYPVGGIIYFSQNLKSREQTISMISNIQAYSKLGLFIAVDEEGGTVARIGDNSSMGTTSFPNMGKVGDSGDTEQAYQVGKTIGSEIAQLGFNLDFAPVADVFSNPDNTVIGNRAFSEDPQVAAQMVAACVKGFNDSGVLCTLKHFPGHGDTGTDSHYGAAEADKNLEQLQECEFLPFLAGMDAGAPVVMIGHITLPNVTEEDMPATLSREIVTGLLRETLGYEGLVITDAMNMGAISNHYDSGEAAVMALQAGVDIILMPKNLDSAVDGIREALEKGELTQKQIDEKVLRILETKIEAGIIAQ